MQFSNYQDNIENTDGIYTGFSEDAHLDIPSIAPILLVSKKSQEKIRKRKLS